MEVNYGLPYNYYYPHGVQIKILNLVGGMFFLIKAMGLNDSLLGGAPESRYDRGAFSVRFALYGYMVD